MPTCTRWFLAQDLKFFENQNTLRFHYTNWAPSILLRSTHYELCHVLFKLMILAWKNNGKIVTIWKLADFKACTYWAWEKSYSKIWWPNLPDRCINYKSRCGAFDSKATLLNYVMIMFAPCKPNYNWPILQLTNWIVNKIIILVNTFD